MKKKIIIIVSIIVVILLIAGIVFFALSKNNEDTTSKLAKVYNDLKTNQTYTFTIQNGDKYKYSFSKKNGQTSIENYTGDGNYSTTLIKDGNTYLLIHNDKEYYVYANNESDSNIVEEQFAFLENVAYETGKEKINGKNYKYEEYSNFSYFITSTNKDIDESQIKTRLYFDKDKLVYMKTMVEGEPYLSVNITHDVNDNLFAIPSDYAESVVNM